MAKLPEMEIDGVMSEEMEARVWELRMPGLDKAGQLAVELDRLCMIMIYIVIVMMCIV